MKVWIIIGHLVLPGHPESDLPVHHGTTAFSSAATCESWREQLGVSIRTECKMLVVTSRVAQPANGNSCE